MSRSFIVSVLFAAMSFSLGGCQHVGDPSDDEKQQLIAWSAAVTEKDRAEVQRLASTHTEWMEKKRVQWMITQYRTRWYHLQTKQATTKSTTQSTQPSTQSTQPTTVRSLF